jgi:hypothetical protein
MTTGAPCVAPATAAPAPLVAEGDEQQVEAPGDDGSSGSDE